MKKSKVLSIFFLSFVSMIFLFCSCSESTNKNKPAKETLKSSKPEISVGISVDKGNIYQALVTIQSLINNSKSSTFYRIFILSDELEDSDKEKFVSQEVTKNNCKFEFVNMTDISKNVFANSLKSSSYYKLNMQNILLNSTKKCITLDAGVLVMSDLEELLNLDLFDSCVSGVLDCRVCTLQEDYREKFSIEHFNQYINSSVLVWNLEKCRLENLLEKFLEFSKNYQEDELPFKEQCILNSVCVDKIKDLSIKFNCIPLKNGDEEDEFFQSFSEEDLKEAKKSPRIINFLHNPPWVNTETAMSEKWWETAKNTKFWDEILNKFLFKK